MYHKTTFGWLKHIDYILFDILCVQIAYFLAYMLRYDSFALYSISLYRNMGYFLVIATLLIIVMFETFKDLLNRGYYLELVASVKQAVILLLGCSLFLFITQKGDEFSRVVLFTTIGLYIPITYCMRLIWKRWVKHLMLHMENDSLVLVTTTNNAKRIIEKIKRNNYKMYKIAGLIIIDEDLTGEYISDIPVISNLKNASDCLLQMWVDELFVDIEQYDDELYLFLDQCIQMGLTIHYNLPKKPIDNIGKQYVESMGEITVLTRSLNYMSYSQACLKRTIDIVVGLVGCIATIFITLIIGPIIYIKSPGPIFFSQERIGKNGRVFKMYKFRSMYLDAEDRKAELMKHNKMSNDLMFKLDFDPRIIGNKILPDGTKKTGIGQFIRSTSLDEFPQFFNILIGQMSLVGYRPALPSEYEQYRYHHRARIAAKPGLTGMWQASGRSDITDFEEVVRLDTEYITNWSMGLDFRIIFKTAISVLKREGSM